MSSKIDHTFRDRLKGNVIDLRYFTLIREPGGPQKPYSQHLKAKCECSIPRIIQSKFFDTPF